MIHLPPCPQVNGAAAGPCSCSRLLRAAKDRVRLVSSDGAALATASQSSASDRAWNISVWTPDREGETMCGGLHGERRPTREAAIARLEELRPVVDEAHRFHVAIARGLGFMFSMPEQVELGSFAPRMRVNEADVTTSTGGLVAMLRGAAQGDPEIEKLLSGAADRMTARLATGALPTTIEAHDARAALAHGAGEVERARQALSIADAVREALGFASLRGLQNVAVAACRQGEDFARQYGELAQALGCGPDASHEDVLRRAREIGGGT